MAYTIIDTGGSRSVPAEHALARGAAKDGEVAIIIGTKVGPALDALKNRESKAAVLLELDTECLGLYTGEGRGPRQSRFLKAPVCRSRCAGISPDASSTAWCGLITTPRCAGWTRDLRPPMTW